MNEETLQTVKAGIADASQKIEALTPQVKAFAENVVDAERLSSEQPLTFPPAQASQAGALAEEFAAQAVTTRKTSEAERQAFETQQAKKEADASRAELMSRIGEAEGVMRSRGQQEEDAGLPQLRVDIADLTSQIEAKEHALRRQVEKIETEPGLSRGQRANRIDAISRVAAREMADLSIVQNSKLRRFEAVQADIDRRIQLDLEPLMFRLQFDQMFYQENQANFTKQEDREFGLRIQAEEREYNEALQTKQQIGRVAEAAAQFGASATEIGQIFEGKTFEQALSTGSEFLGRGWALQVEQAAFGQWAQKQQISQGWQSLSFQEQSANQQALQTSLAMDKEARDELKKTDAYSNWEIRGLVANDLDNTLSEFGGTAVREQVDWDSISKVDSAVNAIATQLVYSRNPNLRRAMDLGDSSARTAVQDRIYDVVQRELGGKNVSPQLLKDRTREIDTNYRASTQAYNAVVNDIVARYPGAILPEYNIAEVQSGASTSVLDNLLNEFTPSTNVLNSLWGGTVK